MTSRAKSPVSLALLLVFILPVGCGKDDAGEQDGPQEAAKAGAEEIGRRLNDYRRRLETLLSAPWFPREKVYPRLLDARGQADSWVRRAAELGTEGDLPASLLEQGRAMLGTLDRDLAAVVEMAEMLAPLARRAHEIHKGIRQQLQALQVPRETDFPLRRRYADGWLPRKEEWLAELDTALFSLLLEKEAQRGKLVQTNLRKTVQEGGKLLDRLNRLMRHVRTTPQRIARLEKLPAWARGLLEEASERAGEDQRSRILEAVREVEQELPPLRRSWGMLREALIADEEGAFEQMDAFNLRIADLRRRILDPALPLARELDHPLPGEGG